MADFPAARIAIESCEIFGVAAFLSPATRRIDFSTALLYALDFWTAAGLIRLSEDAAWETLLTAALIVAVRKVCAATIARITVNLLFPR